MGYGSKDIKNIVKEILEEKKDIGGIKNIILWDVEDHLVHFIRQKHLWKENHRF